MLYVADNSYTALRDQCFILRIINYLLKGIIYLLNYYFLFQWLKFFCVYNVLFFWDCRNITIFGFYITLTRSHIYIYFDYEFTQIPETRRLSDPNKRA